MFLQKLAGDRTPLPPKPDLKPIILAGLGGTLAIGIIAWLAQSLETALVLGSFGASCVLIFGFPDSPFSQPRNVIGGHFISSLIGLICITLLGPHWWSVAIAAGLAIGLGIAYRPTAKLALYGALALSLFYVVAGSILLPRLWAEPLGPLWKIWPILALNSVALAILDDR